MPKHIAVVAAALILFITPAVLAQASGNVGQSGPYARWELDNAQNPPALNLAGCLAYEGGDYVLLPKRGKPVLLNFTDDDAARRLVGSELKIRGRQNMGAGRREEPPFNFLIPIGGKGEHRGRYTVSSPVYFNVDRVQVLADSCGRK